MLTNYKDSYISNIQLKHRMMQAENEVYIQVQGLKGFSAWEGANWFNNFCESKQNLLRAPQETELGNVPVSQWPSPHNKQGIWNFN